MQREAWFSERLLFLLVSCCCIRRRHNMQIPVDPVCQCQCMCLACHLEDGLVAQHPPPLPPTNPQLLVMSVVCQFLVPRSWRALAQTNLRILSLQSPKHCHSRPQPAAPGPLSRSTNI